MNKSFLVSDCKNIDDFKQNIDNYSKILLKNKVIGFKNISITDEEFGQIIKLLYRGANTFAQLNAGLIYDQNHAHDTTTSSINSEEFIYGHWHVDNPFYAQTPCYTGMHMHVFTCSPNVGQTHFINLADMYEKCPKDIIEKLMNTEMISATGCLPENINKLVPHPAIISHPVTNENMIYWTGHDMRLQDGEDKEWFSQFKIWISKFISDPKNRKTWTWNQGDILIWDNRAVAHSFSPGWKHSERIFSRCEVGFEKLIPKKPI